MASSRLVLPDGPEGAARQQGKRVTAGEYRDAGGMAPIYVGRVPSAAGQDYRDLARSLLGLLEVARRTLVDEEAPSELVARVTSHLGCELSGVVAVHERFAIWDP
jgi:hypothetical protein